MKITYYDKFALIPKRCSICNKLFWLEWYNYRVKLVGIEMYPLELPVCHSCAEEENNRCNFATRPHYEELTQKKRYQRSQSEV